MKPSQRTKQRMTRSILVVTAFCSCIFFAQGQAQQERLKGAVKSPIANVKADVFDRVEHHETDNDGVALHYVTLGEGPVILFVHGFPDFWYTWREQMAALSDNYKTVAMDTRAYNKSG